METVSSSTSRRLFFKLPVKNFRKNNRSTGQEIDRSNSRFCNNVSGSHRNIKQKKGWWDNNIKAARKEIKECVRRYALRQSLANLRKIVEVRGKNQTAISGPRLKKQI